MLPTLAARYLVWFKLVRSSCIMGEYLSRNKSLVTFISARYLPTLGSASELDPYWRVTNHITVLRLLQTVPPINYCNGFYK